MEGAAGGRRTSLWMRTVAPDSTNMARRSSTTTFLLWGTAHFGHPPFRGDMGGVLGSPPYLGFVRAEGCLENHEHLGGNEFDALPALVLERPFKRKRLRAESWKHGSQAKGQIG